MGYISDLRFVMKDIGPMIKKLRKDYSGNTDPKIKLIDTFILFCITVFITSMCYRIVCPSAPLNALLSSTFVSMGEAVLAMSLRLQLTDPEFKEEQKSKSKRHDIISFFMTSLLLIFFAINYMG